MSDDRVAKHCKYTVTAEMCWKVKTISPVSGKRIECYGDTVDDARRKVDLVMLREANERGLEIKRWDPDEGEVTT